MEILLKYKSSLINKTKIYILFIMLCSKFYKENEENNKIVYVFKNLKVLMQIYLLNKIFAYDYSENKF